MGYEAILSSEVDVDSPGKAELFQKIKDNFDFLYAMQAGPIEIPNGSFEIDTDLDGIPDNWSRNLYAGGSAAFDTTTPAHGAQGYKFTRASGAGNGGGYLESGYLEISEVGVYLVSFDIKSSVAGLKNIVKVRYFDKSKTYLSDQDIYSSTSNPTSWTRYLLILSVPANARYCKIRLIGGYTDTDVAGDTHYDDVAINGRTTNQSLLKTATGSVFTTSATLENITLPGGEYGFYPQVKCDNSVGLIDAKIAYEGAAIGSSYVTNIALAYPAGGGVSSAFAQQRYVTASGKSYWVFLLYDKKVQKIISGYAAPDHPSYGNGDDADIIPHPFANYLQSSLPENLDIILLDIGSTLVAQERATKQRDILQVIREDFNIDDNQEIAFVPRDMDGHRILLEQHPSYVVRRLKPADSRKAV